MRVTQVLEGQYILITEETNTLFTKYRYDVPQDVVTLFRGDTYLHSLRNPEKFFEAWRAFQMEQD
ncbi:hypothetical protein HWD03_gp096 [Alteromonas phage vB_AmeM_PT11-V22]|uniref:Uncharacterized protein n=1 Tax=Alteromonas phage vB_AmeM_PT11-V22 TaxID=2704031 RepID=A0A6C0R1W2_9CAUD|nr:hypothetical protein HWD03_gp096 [Alteromonas phage vB_AmeM_PT11-V22]QHZ59777.1 hypothetical protein [Alteromonas phage vB_AmeM_PT11-V22]